MYCGLRKRAGLLADVQGLHPERSEIKVDLVIFLWELLLDVRAPSIEAGWRCSGTASGNVLLACASVTFHSFSVGSVRSRIEVHYLGVLGMDRLDEKCGRDAAVMVPVYLDLMLVQTDVLDVLEGDVH